MVLGPSGVAAHASMSDVCEKQFIRRRLANGVLAATVEYLLGGMGGDEEFL